jgi:uncharacterized UBP type Zn finger protein
MPSIRDTMRRVVFQRAFERRECAHLGATLVVSPTQVRCAGCIREGTRTVHRRMCLTCGEVGCCDSSPARHARRHHEATGHPLIRSIESGETWAWCYLDEAYIADLPVPRGEPGARTG